MADALADHGSLLTRYTLLLTPLVVGQLEFSLHCGVHLASPKKIWSSEPSAPTGPDTSFEAIYALVDQAGTQRALYPQNIPPDKQSTQLWDELGLTLMPTPQEGSEASTSSAGS